MWLIVLECFVFGKTNCSGISPLGGLSHFILFLHGASFFFLESNDRRWIIVEQSMWSPLSQNPHWPLAKWILGDLILQYWLYTDVTVLFNLPLCMRAVCVGSLWGLWLHHTCRDTYVRLIADLVGVKVSVKGGWRTSCWDHGGMQALYNKYDSADSEQAVTFKSCLRVKVSGVLYIVINEYDEATEYVRIIIRFWQPFYIFCTYAAPEHLLYFNIDVFSTMCPWLYMNTCITVKNRCIGRFFDSYTSRLSARSRDTEGWLQQQGWI